MKKRVNRGPGKPQHVSGGATKVEKSKRTTSIRENTAKIFMNIGQAIFIAFFVEIARQGKLPPPVTSAIYSVGALLFSTAGLLLAAKENPEEPEKE